MPRWRMKSGKGRSKMGNVKTGANDSRREARRAQELCMLEKAGVISNLQEQVRFELVPRQLDEDGRVIERAMSYIADFVYEQDGQQVVEDSKGYRTDVYRIKRKLMLWVHGIRILET